MGELNALLRWIHILAGIVWIGHLYFFNFVNGPFQATMDGPTKKGVNPQLLPRALFWFRYGALWTWVTGVLMLLTIFYMGHAAVADGSNPSGAAYGLLLLTIGVAPFVYDALMKSGLSANMNTAAAVCLAITAGVMMAYEYVGGFGYRGVVIHAGALFGTLMAYNVWFRIWPAQQKIISAVRDGQAPDAALVALAGSRSRQNTFMSVPLLWTMMNEHSSVTVFNLGANYWIAMVIIIAGGWHIVTQLYNRAAKVPGF
jgi:uncharacterized membrane protein